MGNADQNKKRKNDVHPGFQRSLEGILERLRRGLEELANSLAPSQPQPQPIPIPPTLRRRRR